MALSRYFAAASHRTFSIKPVRTLLGRYISEGDVVVDPFARDSLIGTYRNDLNPKTEAEWHLPAEEFCSLLYRKKLVADAALFDPPYSARQVKEHYQSFGLSVTQKDTQMARFYRDVKAGLHKLLRPGGIVICFGWNSGGMPQYLGYERIETMLVCHGSTHYDTIVTVDRKQPVERPRTRQDAAEHLTVVA